MKENTVVAFQNPSDFQKDPLTEVLQAGARELLAQAVEAEVSVFLGSHAALVDAAGRRRVVRNGYLPERFIQTGIGPVSVRQPRVRDRGDGVGLVSDVVCFAVFSPLAVFSLMVPGLSLVPVMDADRVRRTSLSYLAENLTQIRFANDGPKYDKAAACLAKDRGVLLTFYDFPAEHWKHVRTTNPIESTFATVRPRTYRTKGCLSRKTAMAMVFKLCQCAQRKWRKLDGSNHLAEIIRGVKFVDGERQDRAAA